MQRFILLSIILLTSLSLQGCGLAGAFIWFGDRNFNHYEIARANGDTEGARDALRRSHGSYKDSLTYDELRYPRVYVRLAETHFILEPDAPKKAMNFAARGVAMLKGEFNSPDTNFDRISEIADIYACLGRFAYLSYRDPWDQEKIHEAKDHYAAALAKRGGNPAYNAGLISILLHEVERNKLAAAEHLNPLLFSRIEELLENGTSTENPSVLMQEARGIYLFFKDEYAEAIQQFTRVLESDSDFDRHRTSLFLCRSFINVQRYPDALAVASGMLEADPEDYDFLAERAIASWRNGNTSAANLDIDVVEKARPEFHQFFYRIGVAFSESNLAPRAELYLLKAYRLNPEIGVYAFALGKNYLLKGEKLQAKQFFIKAAELAPPGSGLEKEARLSISNL